MRGIFYNSTPLKIPLGSFQHSNRITLRNQIIVVDFSCSHHCEQELVFMDTVTIILRDKEYEVKAGMTLRHALEKIGVNRETVLATRDGELITDDVVLRAGELIKLVAVISGGGLLGIPS
jgi:sulfur carrier protein ThiS